MKGDQKVTWEERNFFFTAFSFILIIKGQDEKSRSLFSSFLDLSSRQEKGLRFLFLDAVHLNHFKIFRCFETCLFYFCKIMWQ